MDNRIAEAIERIKPKVEALDTEARERMEETSQLVGTDHFDYQQVQAQAHAAGKITTAEAQIIYMALGEYQSPDNDGWTEDTDLATKIVVTQIIGELLGVSVG